MKSLKDEIDESIDNFTGPVSQAFRNIRDSISDTVSDVLADSQERGGGYSRPRKKGCLWSFIKWLLILSVISALLSECGAESTVSVETNTQNTTQDTAVEQITETKAPYEMQAESDTIEPIENTYDLLLVSARNNIDTILAGSSVDMDALQSEYEFLLSLRISEYMFKASAYGYFTGDYEGERFHNIIEECDLIQQEMIQYFPKEEVENYYAEFGVLSYHSFDESYIDYDSILVGSEENPDVDAMWLSYIDSLVESAGMDIGNLIDWHGMEMYSTLIPAEPAETNETEEIAPTQSIPVEGTYIEGYVMYGTGGLNIRNGPGVSYEQIGRLPEGEQVVIWETQYSGTAEWGRIERGWICMDYIQIGTLGSSYNKPAPDDEQLYDDFLVGEYWNLEDPKHFWIYSDVGTDGTITYWLEYPLGDDFVDEGSITVPSTDYIPGNHGHTITFHVGDYYSEYVGEFVIGGYYATYGIEYTISANIPGVFDTGGESVTTIGPQSVWGQD